MSIQDFVALFIHLADTFPPYDLAHPAGKLSDRPLQLSCEMLLLHLQPQLLQQISQHQWLEPMHPLVQKPSSRRCRPRDSRLMRVLYEFIQIKLNPDARNLSGDAI